MGSRVGIALAVAMLALSGCDGSSHNATIPGTTESLAPPSGPEQTEVEEKRKEEAEATREREFDERRIREHEPGHFGP